MNELGSGLFRTSKKFKIEQVLVKFQPRKDANEMGEIVKFVWFWAISLCNYVQIRKSQLKPTKVLCNFFHTPKIIIFPNELIPGYFITFALRRNKNKHIFLSFSCFFSCFAFWQHPNWLNFLTNPLLSHFWLPTGACSSCKIIEKYSKTTFFNFIFISA